MYIVFSNICISKSKSQQSFCGKSYTLKKHSLEIRGLCLMKCSSEMLQNLPYFWNTIIHSLGGKYKVSRNGKRKKLRGFSYT